MLESLDAIIATAAIILGLSLIVQAVQQIMKQWLDLKSNYMRLQLLGIFDPTQGAKETTRAGMKFVTTLAEQADETAKTMVNAIEGVFKSFGYKDLELLEDIDATKFKQIVSSIDWSKVPGLQGIDNALDKIKNDIDVWFDLARKAYQDLYERRMKLWSFVLSAVVVVALDANLFRVYSEFTVNTPLRNAAVAWAQKNVPVSTPSTVAAKDSGKNDVATNDSLRAVNIRAQVDTIRAILGSDGFQVLGWKTGSFRPICTQGWFWNWVGGFVGWVGMTLLVGLGAPFWYDFLKAVMGVKEQLKGKKKSS